MAILSKQIGWSNESNLLWEILKKLNRLAGIITGLKPKYKVFTALVTQSGGDDLQEQASGALTKGVSYYYDELFEGSDFTNVGGPKYGDLPNSGGYFIATATGVPNNYNGTVIRWNNGAPVVTVLENTIGNVWFNYYGEGIYRFVSNNLFTIDKTMIIGSTFYNVDADATIVLNSFYGENSDYRIWLRSTIGNAAANSVINHTPLEIRVYN